MIIKSEEAAGNGTKRNFVECPFCGQKMFNIVSLGGEVKIVAKCRRCHRFVKIRMVP